MESWSDSAWLGRECGSRTCATWCHRHAARFVTIGCEPARPGNDYTTSLRWPTYLLPNVLLAWGLDGKELPPAKGFPLRLVVPHKYAYKSAKWVRWIRFTVEQEPGYWERPGYSDSADPSARPRRRYWVPGRLIGAQGVGCGRGKRLKDRGVVRSSMRA